MKFKSVAIGSLTPWAKNPKSVKKSDLERLKSQITKLGVYKPLIVTEENIIVGGNQRWLALRELGVDEVEVSVVHAPTDTAMLEYALSDNDQVGRYEEKELVGLIQGLDSEFDLKLFKLDLREPIDLDKFMDLHKPVVEDEPELDNVPGRVKRGELWRLGKHRLLCGDATKAEDVRRLMAGEKADLFVTDPPYGVSYGDKNAFLNAFGQGNRIQDNLENDTLPPEKMHELWSQAFTNAENNLKDGGSYYVCAPQGGLLLLLLLEALKNSGMQLKQSIIWTKNNIVLGRSDYQYQHEPIIYGWKEGKGHDFYGEPGESSVWKIDKPIQSKLHPTMKPVELFAKAIKNSSLTQQRVLDLFAGSGTTLIACEQLNRTAYNMEIDPHYSDIIIARWEQLTNQKATREELG